MRVISALAAGLILAGISAVNAQAQNQQPQPSAAPSQATGIRNVEVTDIGELSKDAQTEANRIGANKTQADYQKLRSLIESIPMLTSALDSKGLTSANVLTTSLNDDGVLTLVTKK
jgi:hypothetical protein